MVGGEVGGHGGGEVGGMVGGEVVVADCVLVLWGCRRIRRVVVVVMVVVSGDGHAGRSGGGHGGGHGGGEWLWCILCSYLFGFPLLFC